MHDSNFNIISQLEAREDGAVSNFSDYLTRDEWNAAFFVSMHAFVEGRIAPPPHNFGEQLRLGVILLSKAGMKFEGLMVTGDAPEDVLAVTPVSNEAVMVAMASGRLNVRQRLDEFLAWADKHPEVDVAATVASIRAQLAALPPAPAAKP